MRQWCRDCVCGAERELVLPLGIGEVVGRERATEKGQTVLREWARSLEGVGQQVGGGGQKKRCFEIEFEKRRIQKRGGPSGEEKVCRKALVACEQRD